MEITTTSASSSGFLSRWKGRRVCQIVTGMVTIGALTMVVKLMAFGKDLVVARHFGTTDVMDAFLVAWLVASIVPQLLSQAMPSTLVPAYAELREKSGQREADRLAVTGTWVYAAQLAILMGVLWFAGEWLVTLLTPKFSPDKQAQTVRLFHELIPFGFLHGMSYILTAWLHANKRFALAALSPAVIPLCILVVLLLGGGVWGVHSLSVGALIGALLLIFMLGWAVAQTSQYSLWKPARLCPEGRRMARESTPLMLSGMMMLGMPLVDQLMAGWLESGSVSVMSYSEKITGIFLTLAATAAAQALYPFLAEQASKKDWRGLRSTLLKYAGGITAASLPLVGVIWVLAPYLVSTLFERGAFHEGDTERVANVLRYHALQIPFFIVAVIASRVVLSLRASRFMLLSTVINLVSNIGLNLLLMKPLGTVGLALSTAIVALLSGAMLVTYILVAVRRNLRAENFPLTNAP